MRLSALSYTAWLALSSTASAIGLHAATHKSLLLVAPSFSGDAIELHPALHPDHDSNNLAHLHPTISAGLHWSQEGHRSAVHGAKHAHMKSTFNYPTVVLEHSNLVESVECEDDRMKVCFSSPLAMSTVLQTWTADGLRTLNIVTYHSGCGDESGRRRSFFIASSPVFNLLTSCVTMPVARAEEKDILDSGELKWGTYVSPHEKRDTAVKGHVRVTGPVSEPQGPTDDITKNSTALRDFFAFETVYTNGTNENSTSAGIDTSGEDHPEADGLDFISYDGEVSYNDTTSRRALRRRALTQRRLEERGLFTWLDNAITWFVNQLVSGFRTIANIIAATANIIKELALLAADLIAVIFGAKFERSYHNDIKASYFAGGKAGSPPPTIADIKSPDGFEISGRSGAFDIKCVKCGIEAEMSVDGELAFSIKEGITKGEVALINKEDFNLHAIFGIMLEGSVEQEIPGLKKQLASLPLSPLAIPGIFTLGPQLSVSVAVSLMIEGNVNLLIGGTATIGPGTARLSLVNQSRNALEGFQPSFNVVAEATSGSITASADLGLPLAIEVGIDVLNGAFKKTVGMVDAPSIFIAAEYSKNEDKKCDGGVELRFGIRNKLYLTAFDTYEYTLDERKLFETGLTCITTTKYNDVPVKPDQDVYKDVAKAFGGEKNLATNSTPKVQDVAKDLTTTVKGNEGFRIVMDEMETSILVSGTDNYVYLSEKKQGYDLSAPWGSLNVSQGVLDFDVFGRMICVNGTEFYHSNGLVMVLRLCDPQKVPKHHKVTALSELKTKDTNYHTYGVSVPFLIYNPHGPSKTDKFFFYPTACKVKDHGLRVFLTRYLVDKNGNAINDRGKDVGGKQEFFMDRLLGVKNIHDCRTIKLTSTVQGSDKKQKKS